MVTSAYNGHHFATNIPSTKGPKGHKYAQLQRIVHELQGVALRPHSRAPIWTFESFELKKKKNQYEDALKCPETSPKHCKPCSAVSKLITSTYSTCLTSAAPKAGRSYFSYLQFGLLQVKNETADLLSLSTREARLFGGAQGHPSQTCPSSPDSSEPFPADLTSTRS